MPRPLTFVAWLLCQTDRDDSIGNLARDVRDDIDKGRFSGGSSSTLRLYMEAQGAGRLALEILESTVKTWEQEVERALVAEPVPVVVRREHATAFLDEHKLWPGKQAAEESSAQPDPNVMQQAFNRAHTSVAQLVRAYEQERLLQGANEEERFVEALGFIGNMLGRLEGRLAAVSDAPRRDRDWYVDSARLSGFVVVACDLSDKQVQKEYTQRQKEFDEKYSSTRVNKSGGKTKSRSK